MTGLYLLIIFIFKCFDPKDLAGARDSINHSLGMHMPGWGMFFIFLIIIMVLDSLLARNK